MSKRRNRKSKPNLPQATIDRARRQLETGEDIPEEVETFPDDDQDEEQAAPPPVAAQPKPAERVAPVSQRRTPSREERTGRRRETARPVSQRRRQDEPDMETIQRMLANPTKTVSSEQLREEYRYVMDDLKRVAVLVVGMVILLAVLGLLI